jgi:hypothetical protein
VAAAVSEDVARPVVLGPIEGVVGVVSNSVPYSVIELNGLFDRTVGLIDYFPCIFNDRFAVTVYDVRGRKIDLVHKKLLFDKY